MTAPRIKVFDAYGKYQASTHDYAAAACLMALYGDGATVRLGHSKKDVIWTEGQDGNLAEDYDQLAEVIAADDERIAAALDKMVTGAWQRRDQGGA